MFITIEGLDGVGKTTLCNHLIKTYEKTHTVAYFREPGCTNMAEQIRTLVTEPRSEPVSPLCEALLMYAARAQFVERVLIDSLSKYDIVICDRFDLSTWAYQIVPYGLNMALFDLLSKEARCNLEPDLTIVLDTPTIPETHKDRIEQRDESYKRKVKQAFLDMATRGTKHALLIRLDLVGNMPVFSEQNYFDITSTINNILSTKHG